MFNLKFITSEYPLNVLLDEVSAAGMLPKSLQLNVCSHPNIKMDLILYFMQPFTVPVKTDKTGGWQHETRTVWHQ